VVFQNKMQIHSEASSNVMSSSKGYDF